MDPHGTCPGVGHTMVTAFAVYCPHEMAWTLRLDARTWHTDSEATTILEQRMPLGPFDTASDALTWLHTALAGLWAAPNAPWD